jgi:hypothetical protein
MTPLWQEGAALPRLAGLPSTSYSAFDSGSFSQPFCLYADATGRYGHHADATLLSPPVRLLLLDTGPTLLPLSMLMLMDLPEVGAEYMGSIGGIYFTIAEIGGFLGPLVVGVLVDLTGTFIYGASFLAFLSIAIACLFQRLKISQETQPSALQP